MAIIIGTLALFGYVLYVLMGSGKAAPLSSTSTLRSAVFSSTPLDHYTLLKQGVPARGILLQVSSQRSCQGTASQGFFEVRTISMEVEVPGDKPYQVNGPVSIPLNISRGVLPGATVELRVNPGNQSNVAVYGPGVGLASTGISTPALSAFRS